MTDTGLPELPDEYFWRVKTNNVEIRKNLPDTEWGVPRNYYGNYDFDDGIDRTGESREREVVTTTEVGFWFWKRDKTETNTVRETRSVNRSQRVFQQYTDYSGETYTTPAYRGYITDYASGTIKFRLPVTRENLPALCEKALERWNAEKAAKELLGDYPPKKLN